MPLSLKFLINWVASLENALTNWPTWPMQWVSDPKLVKEAAAKIKYEAAKLLKLNVKGL